MGPVLESFRLTITVKVIEWGKGQVWGWLPEGVGKGQVWGWLPEGVGATPGIPTIHTILYPMATLQVSSTCVPTGASTGCGCSKNIVSVCTIK